MSDIHIDLQVATEISELPSEADIQRWVEIALSTKYDRGEVCVRIVDNDEIAELNANYRKKQGPTNVLSFPFDTPAGVDGIDLLGDIIISAPKVIEEAKAQEKLPQAHWAHLLIHGSLHLLGYDHTEDEDAEIMEALEIQLLDRLNFANPYETGAINAQ